MMTILVNTSFENAKVILSLDGMLNVIDSVNTVVVVSDEDTGYIETGSDYIKLGPPDPSQFTDYNSVTKDMITEWVTPKQQYADLVARVTANLQTRLQPVIEDKPLPFNITLE